MIKATVLNDDGGINFDAKGQRTFVSGIDGLVQRHKNRLLLFRGEWFRDESLGIPYFTEFLGTKRPKLAAMRTAIASELLEVPETTSISNLIFDVDNGTRNLTIDYSATSQYGETSSSVEVSV